MNISNSTYQLACDRTFDHNYAGILIINEKVFRNSTTEPRRRSFNFNLLSFIYDEHSEERRYFGGVLRRQGVENIDVHRMLHTLVLYAHDVVSLPGFSITHNVTIDLSLHIREIQAPLSEEEAIEDAINNAKITQRPASQSTIDDLKQTSDLAANVCNKLSDANCSICLNHYQENQRVISIECNHIFCENCIINWLRTNSICPLCRKYIK